jgi:hypothetical protein
MCKYIFNILFDVLVDINKKEGGKKEKGYE